MMKVLSFFLFFCLFLFAVHWNGVVVSAEQCSPRSYGFGSVVCVCNQTYCDDIDPLDENIDQKIAIVYTSSKDGDRFLKSYLEFNSETHTKTVTTKNIVKFKVDPSIKYQSIYGFGGAFTDSFGLNLLALPENMQQMLLESYYGETGLEYNLGRVPIAGTDFSWRGYTYDDNPDDFELSKFQLQEEDLIYKIPIIKRVRDLSARELLLFASPWSPPTWIKSNNDFVGGFIIGKPGEKYYNYWARYLVRFLEEYKSRGLPIEGMTVQNEPNFKNIISSLCLTPDEHALFMKKDLGPELAKYNYTKENGFYLMVFDAVLYNFTNYAKMLDDPEIRNMTSVFAFHDYQDLKENLAQVEWFNENYPDISIGMTETSLILYESPIQLGDWFFMEKYSQSILEFINRKSRTWVDWNLALDTKGGPNWFGNYVDSPIIVNASASEFYKQPSFYAIGHFSKFIPQGSFRIDHERVLGGKYNLTVTTFQRPDNRKVMVILNKEEISLELKVEIEENDELRSDRHHDKEFKTTLKPKSINTIIWQ